MSRREFLAVVGLTAVGVFFLALAGILHGQRIECNARGGTLVDDGALWYACVEPRR